VVGPRLVYADGSFQRWTAGRAPDLVGIASFFLFFERFSKAAARRSIYIADDVTEAFQPDWVSSACMLVRRDALDEVGLMDERYFYGMDDVDLCQRFRAAGWNVWYDPASEVIHLMGDGRVTKKASPAGIRNFADYFTRRNGRVKGAIARALAVLGFCLRGVAYAGLALVHPGQGDRQRSRDHFQNARVSLQRGHV